MILKQKKIINLIILTFSVLLAFSGCRKSRPSEEHRVVIWTSCSEFAQYIELFNSIHKDNRAILVYKDNSALSLPPAKDELLPDIIVDSWLRTDNLKRNFRSLDYLFDNQLLKSDIFYPQLLESGKKNHSQYLLPVSFNLPAIIFSNENKDLITDNYTLTLQQIREIASPFNQKNKNGNYTRMGFTVLNNADFSYLATKLNGVHFHDEKGQIAWNESKLNETAGLLKEWIETENTSVQVEDDFAFKYLFMPNYRQVTSGRTLFAYTESASLFKMLKEQDFDIDYRWIVQDKKIPISDGFIMMGIYKDCTNQVGATEFIRWFFQSESQRQILERKEAMALETEIFGISGGFSALRDVTEHILPVFYNHLLTNLPPTQMLTVPQILPPRWDSYKTQVVEPYLRNAISASDPATIPSISDLEQEWRKKVFD
ncbi:MAG: ABC transporter substrate-binding protein [Treponema sp.]|nr:ABC transporter substrate-binding protein [Treponema sp.]